jgi:cell division protein ZipA
MQANWSLILNVLLLISVIVAIARLLKSRKQQGLSQHYQPPPSFGQTLNRAEAEPVYSDDIIAVRKISEQEEWEVDDLAPSVPLSAKPSQPQLLPQEMPFTPIKEEASAEVSTSEKSTWRGPAGSLDPADNPANKSWGRDVGLETRDKDVEMREEVFETNSPSTLMLFLLSKENRQFAGYELLQTVLAAGLRFGEGGLFHRHQLASGHGPVLCSLAAATATGVFDLQNMGAFSVRGLCLFMHRSEQPNIDSERFNIMLDTAKQLAEGLDAHLLDDQRKPLTQARIEQYYQSCRSPSFKNGVNIKQDACHPEHSEGFPEIREMSRDARHDVSLRDAERAVEDI